MAGTKKILLITWDRIIKNAFSRQLEDIFEQSVLIDSYALAEEPAPEVWDYQLVLCSSGAIYRKVRGLVPERIKVMPARRAIDLQKVPEVLNLPRDEDVLVVSNYHYTAVETIELLRELGIDHINYIPYHPGVEYRGTRIAITPGGEYLVPEGVEKTIDLGVKLIDVSTIIEILFNLDLPLENTNFLIARYTRKMVNINKYSCKLNTVLKSMLSTSHDGIIALDEKNVIIFFNEMAGELLGIPSQQAIKSEIGEILNKGEGSRKLRKIIADNRNRTNEMVYYNNKYILTNKEILSAGNSFQGKVISFQDTTRIQKIEYEVRKKLLRKGFITKYTFRDIVGSSDQLQRTVNIARKTALNDLTVLIRGESGTGKELFAQAIHQASKRGKNPFVAVNFASLPESLIESELFGYAEGAFTGARKGGKIGHFEQAHTGTIFIDEIGDAPLTLQARLLRVLQEKEIMKVGGNSIIPVDVRVIAATNKDLDRLVEEGRFRSDLYYRLKVLHFTVPPLRERPEDVSYLSEYFLKKNSSPLKIAPEVYEVLSRYHWPGNVRELENLINYFISVIDSDRIEIDHLPEELYSRSGSRQANEESGEKVRLKETLLKQADFEEYLVILQELELARKNGRGLGRNRLTSRLDDRETRLTANMVRKRLKTLEEEGLVSIGRTRQGTSITAKGREILAYFSSSDFR